MNRRKKTIYLCSIISIFIIAIFIAGFFITEEMYTVNFTYKKQPPSISNLFGTDWLGRDMLARTIKGLSISVLVGFVASSVSAVIAVIVGILAATGSKLIDTILNFVINLIMGIPHIVLLILISFLLGGGLKGILVGVAVTHWTSLARLIRSEVLQIRTEQYIAVSRKLGHSNSWILIYHILPHIIPQFVIGLVLLFPHAILHESSLTFLGYGLPPEQPAIGIILAESMKYLSSGMWWLAVLPGLALVLFVLLFDLLGENLKKLIDPYSAQE